ncbi:MAG: hypothetical protein PF574_05650 [Candidatus Delongbacteria bacterium]|jgi:hypothetical protein|nr:hypothetical protein [Candidatus Delongbacteria bacterium]
MRNLLDIETIKQLLPERNHNDIYSLLSIFTDMGVNKDIFNINDNGIIEVQTSDVGQCFPLEVFIDTASKLNNLKYFENFNSFTNGFNNPSQISATIFEVNCANYIINKFKYKNIRFEPEVSIKGQKKNRILKLRLMMILN